MVDGERLGVAARAVESKHELRAQPLTQWLRPHQRVQLANQLGVSADGEIIVMAILETGEAKLIQAGNL